MFSHLLLHYFAPATTNNTEHTMKTKHTPSPWYTDTAGQGDITVTSTHDKHGSDQDVCEVYGASDEEQAANAALIAAAPDLLAAPLGTSLKTTHKMKNFDGQQLLKIAMHLSDRPGYIVAISTSHASAIREHRAKYGNGYPVSHMETLGEYRTKIPPTEYFDGPYPPISPTD